MKQHLQYQAERIRKEIDQLQNTLRKSRRALTAILLDIEDLADDPTTPPPKGKRVDNLAVIG